LALVALLALFPLLQACVTPGGSRFDTPSLNLVSVTPLPAEGFSQRFELGFVIRNPNEGALTAKGMVYDIYFENHKLLSGVSNNIPTVEGYTEGSFDVIASTNMIGSLRLIADLMQQPRNQFAYRLEARLDLSTPIHRKISIEETGELSFSSATTP
jgi:LEA14-like dessication related protein